MREAEGDCSGRELLGDPTEACRVEGPSVYSQGCILP